jgi:hypothetical protein
MSQPNVSPAALILKQLCPDRVRTLVMTLPLIEFVSAFADAPILLVKLAASGDELEAGLSTLKEQPNRAQPELNVLAFHTLVEDRFSERPSGIAPTKPEPNNAADLRRRLSNARHFAVTIEKRSGDGSYVHRIAVGRARNKDIVLRDQSVSKFHAWFEHDPQLGLRVADANSSNGTRRNDKSLTARELTTVQPGDVLRFGSVEAVLCAADTLWHAVAVP